MVIAALSLWQQTISKKEVKHDTMAKKLSVRMCLSWAHFGGQHQTRKLYSVRKWQAWAFVTSLMLACVQKHFLTLKCRIPALCCHKNNVASLRFHNEVAHAQCQCMLFLDALCPCMHCSRQQPSCWHHMPLWVMQVQVHSDASSSFSLNRWDAARFYGCQQSWGCGRG